MTPDHHFFLLGGKEFHFRTPQRMSLMAVTVDMERFDAYCHRVGEVPPPAPAWIVAWCDGTQATTWATCWAA